MQTKESRLEGVLPIWNGVYRETESTWCAKSSANICPIARARPVTASAQPEALSSKSQHGYPVPRDEVTRQFSGAFEGLKTALSAKDMNRERIFEESPTG